METKSKVLRYLLNLDLVVAGISLIALIIATFFGVIMRYFFNNPYTWLEEFQLWSFLWLVFFGSGAAFRSGSHVAIDIIVDLMPSPIKKLMEVFAYIVVVMVLAYFTFHGSNLVRQMATTARTTNILKIPYSIVYMALPIGCILMIINYTIVTMMSLKETEIDKESGEEEWV